MCASLLLLWAVSLSWLCSSERLLTLCRPHDMTTCFYTYGMVSRSSHSEASRLYVHYSQGGAEEWSGRGLRLGHWRSKVGVPL